MTHSAASRGAPRVLMGATARLRASSSRAGLAADAAAAALWQDLSGKLYERMCRVVIGHMDTHPIAFAEFVAPFLQVRRPQSPPTSA